jgi:hypothetical protein
MPDGQHQAGSDSEHYRYPAKPDLVSIAYRLAGLGREFLLVDKGKVGAIQILNKVGTTLNNDARVLPGDAPLFATVRRQIDLWENSADRILTPDKDLVASRQPDLGTRVGNDQPRASRDRRRRSLCCRGRGRRRHSAERVPTSAAEGITSLDL